MECRHQWCAFTAGGDVATAKIAHDRNATEFRKQRAITQLYGVAGVGTVPDGLPVAADRGDILPNDLGFAKQLVDRLRIHSCQLNSENGSIMQFAGIWLLQGKQLYAQAVIERGERVPNDPVYVP